LICFISLLSFAQNDDAARYVDSLKTLVKNAPNDTSKVCYLSDLVENETDVTIWLEWNKEIRTICERNLSKISKNSREYLVFSRQYGLSLNNEGFAFQRAGKKQEALTFYLKAYEVQKKLTEIYRTVQFQSDLAATVNNIGLINYENGNLTKAEHFFKGALDVYKEIKDDNGTAYAYGNLANLNRHQGRIAKALELHLKALKIRERIKDRLGCSTTLNNIANVYQEQGDLANALDYYQRSLAIKKEINDELGTTSVLNNICSIYYMKNDLEKALEYVHQAISYEGRLGEVPAVGLSYHNLGNIFQRKKELTRALENYEKARQIRQKLGDKSGLASTMINIGMVYFEKKDYAKAKLELLRGMNLSKEIGLARQICNASEGLKKVYSAEGKFKDALESFELYIRMKDSISNETTRKASTRSQLKYEYEKQAAADSVAHAKESEIKSAELSRQSAEIKAKKNQQYALFGGLFLVALFSVFMYNRFKVTQKQKRVIEIQKYIVEEQKQLVEEKQLEILDSIRYAKRIQSAQLPSERFIVRSLSRLMKKS
jgi:tetratricopeptide (TPR) repeat protein